ncbi:MerR family transcriptional regulator [Actinosynnema pretiosum]|uniref:MerR family transcriptional regulator n=1 Tax=Actinosynnema pretiosum TaxID=42197 RepID=A0A290Z7A7_9PSEU|nr:MerR family transcriptional regulator [Actinosynnema pretiosum]ATE54862.1 MerR family transcriptional regulator [Actinosynnema pretiosum]
MTSVTDAPLLTIGDVAGLTGLSVHAVRFYEREGLFVSPVRRNAAGRRVFGWEDVGWLRACARLRGAGMPVPEIRRYAELVRAGEGTVRERLALLRAHEERMAAQVAELTSLLGVVRGKVALYEAHLEAGSAQALWVDSPDCSPPAPPSSPSSSSGGVGGRR